MPLFFFLFLILYLLFVIVIFVGLLLLCVYEIFTFSRVFVVFMNVQLNSIQLLLLLVVAGLFLGTRTGLRLMKAVSDGGGDVGRGWVNH